MNIDPIAGVEVLVGDMLLADIEEADALPRRDALPA
jgi:hypothetical protein